MAGSGIRFGSGLHLPPGSPKLPDVHGFRDLRLKPLHRLLLDANPALQLLVVSLGNLTLRALEASCSFCSMLLSIVL